MKRKFRLTKTTDYQRVRRNGRTYAHPLIVLIAQPNDSSSTQFAVTANRSVGNAVQRNRIKRKIREIIRKLLPQVAPGWNVIILARRSISEASFLEIETALQQLMHKAKMII